MTTQDEERMKSLLKQAMPPIGNTGPGRDLWPAMRRRLDAQPAPVPWFDWALAGSLAVFAFAFPAAIPVFFYYL
jgi:hypothetical protein